MKKTGLIVNIDHPAEGVVIIRLDGAIDTVSNPDFGKVVFSEMEKGNSTLIFNMDQVRQLSSCGLGTIMGAYAELQEKTGEIRLCGVQPKIKKVMRLIGFDPIRNIWNPTQEGSWG